MMNTLPCMITGVDRHPYGAFQMRLEFGSAGSVPNLSGKLVSVATPFCVGPRQWVQSEAERLAAKNARNAKKRTAMMCLFIRSPFLRFLRLFLLHKPLSLHLVTRQRAF